MNFDNLYKEHIKQMRQIYIFFLESLFQKLSFILCLTRNVSCLYFLHHASIKQIE